MTLNTQVATRLDEVGDLLLEQGASPFRVQAYRHGAETVRRLDRPVSDILEQEGVGGLRILPGIGDRLAIAIRDIVRIGRLPMLDRLRGESDPVELLRTVPGIGARHAQRLHDERRTLAHGEILLRASQEVRERHPGSPIARRADVESWRAFQNH